MKMRTTVITLITASTLFTGCVSETVALIIPSSTESTTKTSLADSNLTGEKSYLENKTAELSDKTDKKIDTGINKLYGRLMGKLGLNQTETETKTSLTNANEDVTEKKGLIERKKAELIGKTDTKIDTAYEKLMKKIGL